MKGKDVSVCLLGGWVFFVRFVRDKNLFGEEDINEKKMLKKPTREEGEKQCQFENLLSFLSQLSTLAFQSQVCFSMSNAKPEGQVICFSPARVHLKSFSLSFDYRIMEGGQYSECQVSGFVFGVRFIIQCYPVPNTVSFTATTTLSTRAIMRQRDSWCFRFIFQLFSFIADDKTRKREKRFVYVNIISK